MATSGEAAAGGTRADQVSPTAMAMHVLTGKGTWCCFAVRAKGHCDDHKDSVTQRGKPGSPDQLRIMEMVPKVSWQPVKPQA